MLSFFLRLRMLRCCVVDWLWCVELIAHEVASDLVLDLPDFVHFQLFKYKLQLLGLKCEVHLFD